MDSRRFWRQLDLCPPEKLAFPITVLGAGAIGSAAVVTLAKMGCSDLTVWDDDVVSEHNLPNQMCLVECLGLPKVGALARLVEGLTGVRIQPVASRYRGERIDGVVVSAVDSMTARRMIWKSVKLRKSVPLFLDARMGAEVLRLYALRPTDLDAADFFEANLYAENEAELLPCSARSIVYCPAVAGALVAALVKAYAVGEVYPREILLDLPRMRLVASWPHPTRRPI